MANYIVGAVGLIAGCCAVWLYIWRRCKYKMQLSWAVKLAAAEYDIIRIKNNYDWLDQAYKRQREGIAATQKQSEYQQSIIEKQRKTISRLEFSRDSQERRQTLLRTRVKRLAREVSRKGAIKC